ncbi:MAG: succinate--CoA ligase subunit beta [Thermoplasmata archaeon]
MRLYEYEAKEILGKAKIPIPSGRAVHTSEEARTAAEEIGLPVVIKAQILVGGRGKAGGIDFADSIERVEEIAGRLLKTRIKDTPVDSVLVEKKVENGKEIYIGVTIDRFEFKPIVIVSSEGGVDIEEVAERSPDSIHRLHVEVGETLRSYQGRLLAKSIGMQGKMISSVGSIIQRLYGVFKKYDAKIAEINPLIVSDESTFAADAKLILDDDSLFRHPDLKERGISLRHDVSELTEREKIAQAEGIPYLDLDGNIGMFPGGAGFGIASIDLVKQLGGEPANFMDSGGGPTPERIAKMLDLLVDNPRVVAIFGARFGGISRCDDFAKGVVMFLESKGTTKPMIMRMTGNKWKEGMEILEKAKKEHPELFEKVEVFGIETPIEDVARRTVEVAKKEAGGQ